MDWWLYRFLLQITIKNCYFIGRTIHKLLPRGKLFLCIEFSEKSLSNFLTIPFSSVIPGGEEMGSYAAPHKLSQT